ncbi:MAG: beta-lactamase family protein, partial [Proteobacteria bacterium]|nr:beta-lactamase family protein [Pseudomonadota bacterium]
ALAVALLERDGRIDPNADIHRYLPELPAYGATVTVSDLIHHTSGFRDSNILLDLAQRDQGDRIRQAQVLRLVGRETSLRYPPGSEFSYTNTGYVLLAEIVARTSGMSFRQFTTERIFKPLGMSHTFFRDDASAVIPGWSDSYSPKPGGGWRRSIYNAEAVGSTGLATTSEDLLKWVANFDHPVLGDQALLDEITTSGKLRSGADVNYGYGLWRQSFAGRDAITHNGAIAAYRSVLVWLPKERLGVVVLANMPADVEALAGKVIEAYLGKAPAGPKPQKEDAAPIHPDVAELDGLTGRYIPHGLWSVDMVREGDKLVWTSSTLPRAEITLRERDIFTRGQGDAARWYHFLRDPAGRVTGFQLLSELGATGSGDIFRRAPVYSAPPAALREFVGDYHSADVDVTYTVVLKDGHLAAHALWSASDAKLVSVAPDRFDTDTIGLGVLAARRDPAGRLTGFDIVAGGLSGLTLDRVAPPRTHRPHGPRPHAAP